MRYSLRATFVGVALFAGGFYFLSLAYAKRADVLAFFVGVSILATLIGGGIGFACRLRTPWPRRLALVFAVLFGMAAGTFAVVNIEWKGDGPYKGRPGPVSDEQYVAMAVVRSGLLGGVIGCSVLSIFRIAAGNFRGGDGAPGNDAVDEVRPAAVTAGGPLGELAAGVLRPGRLLAGGVILGALVYAWWPYLPFYAEQRAGARLMDAIEAGDVDLAVSRVPAIAQYRGGAAVVGRVLAQASRGKNERVRIAALGALRAFDAAAFQRLSLNEILREIAAKDADAGVCATAAEWLATIEEKVDG